MCNITKIFKIGHAIPTFDPPSRITAKNEFDGL